MDEAIARSNLARMLSSDEYGMIGLLLSESYGGNAGDCEIDGVSYPCAAANFHYKDNGEILKFTNDCLLSHKLLEGTFKIADSAFKCDAVHGQEKDGRSFKKIVKTLLDARTTAEARAVIEESARQFNERYNKA